MGSNSTVQPVSPPEAEQKQEYVCLNFKSILLFLSEISTVNKLL